MRSVIMEILVGLSKDEMKKIDYFIQNKYFNTDKVVERLFLYFKKNIKKRHFEGGLNDDLRLQMYNHILPNEAVSSPLNNKQKAYLTAKIALLTDLIKQFLMVEALQENEAYQYILLHKKLLKKKRFYTLEKSIRKQKKLLEQKVEKGSDYYFETTQSEQIILDFLYQQGKILKQDNLPELTFNFDAYYLIQQLEYHLTALSLMGASGNDKQYDFQRFNIILDLIRLPQYAVHPLIKSYQLAIEMIQHDSGKAYRELLDLIAENAEAIPKNTLIDFYKLAVSFCARRTKEGKEEYYRHSFEIFKMMSEKDLLLDSNFISVNFLKNIIVAACRVSEFEWAKNMLDQYQPFIRAEVREQTFHFNSAVIEFHQKNYKQVIHHCIRVHRISPTYDVNCRIIELKTYYELDEEFSEATLQRFDTTIQAVRLHKRLSTKDKKAWGNFLYAAKSLYKIKHEISKTDTTGLGEKINNFTSVNDKKWLLEKLDEF